MRENIRALGVLMKREIRMLAGHRIYWFVMIFAPLFCFLFFMDLLKDGLPKKLPVAVVDEDNTTTSRSLVRSLNTFAQTDVVMRTANFSEAREALQRGDVYGIFYIPVDFRRDASTGKEPVLSFYTNDTYFLAGSLLYKDMRMQSNLANGAVQQTLLLAKGEGGPLLAAKLMPIVLDTHPLNNPWLSYAVYLANFLLPAFLCMFVMFTTVYSISEEIKRRTSREWLEAGNGSIIVALMGKLVPQALIFTAMGMLALSMLYGYAHFPLNSGFFPMFLAMVLMILASQCFALFVTGITRRSRIALSACALWSFLFCIPNAGMKSGRTAGHVVAFDEGERVGVGVADLLGRQFFDIRGSGFEWYSDDIFLAELCGIDSISVFTDFYFAKVEVGFVGF